MVRLEDECRWYESHESFAQYHAERLVPVLGAGWEQDRFWNDSPRSSHADPDRESYGKPHANIKSDGDPYRNANGHADRNANGYAHWNANRDPNRHADRNTNIHPNGYTHSHADCNADRESFTHPNE